MMVRSQDTGSIWSDGRLRGFLTSTEWLVDFWNLDDYFYLRGQNADLYRNPSIRTEISQS